MDRLERIVKMAYREWKKRRLKIAPCVDEETLTCFKEGLLPEKETQEVQLHLLQCERCRENVLLDAKIDTQEREVPLSLIQAAEGLVKETPHFETILSLKEKILEVIKTTADFLQTKDIALQPAILRGPKTRLISEEVQLVKYFGNIKVTLKIEKVKIDKVRVSLNLVDKKTTKPLDNLRVSLLKDGQEVESYITRKGEAVFSSLYIGKYALEVSEVYKKLGRIILELR